MGDLRLIALQTTRQKWVTNAPVIQLEDVLAQCIPPEQTRFTKNRSILRHIYFASSLWDSFEEKGRGAKHRLSKCIPHHVTRLMRGNTGSTRYPSACHCNYNALATGPLPFFCGPRVCL